MKHSLFPRTLAILLTLFSLSNPLNNALSAPREKATLAKIVDGDTIDLGDKRRIRLANINAPEHDSPLYKDSLSYLNHFLYTRIEVEPLGKDGYSRTLARLYSGTDYINLSIVKNGYASKFMVRQGEEKTFALAEEEALKQGKGIWKKSSLFGSLSILVNPKEEFVLIENNLKGNNKINLEAYVMKDESRETYTFPKVFAGRIKIYSGKATKNTQTRITDFNSDLVWQEKNIWNDDKDTVYLFDKEGKIIGHYCYGYK